MAAKVKPTPAVPYVVQEDGSSSVLVYPGRAFRLTATHVGLIDPSGYGAKIAFKEAYEAAGVEDGLLASGDTDGGQITLTALPDDAGTLITVVLDDADTEPLQDYAGGKFDLVLETPAGLGIPVLVGTFTTWKAVAPSD